MSKKSMGDYARGWKSPDQKRGEHREKMDAGPKPKGKDSGDSKGPGPGDWRKGNKAPKGAGK